MSNLPGKAGARGTISDTYDLAGNLPGVGAAGGNIVMAASGRLADGQASFEGGSFSLADWKAALAPSGRRFARRASAEIFAGTREARRLAPRVSETVLVASSNAGKIREFQSAAARLEIHVEPLPDFSRLPPAIEDGETFEENARKKAVHYSRFSSAPVFADDSGIALDALGGAPGVHSARFSGTGASDESNNCKLLAALAALPGCTHAAHYVCVIVLAREGRVLAVTEGRADGLIVDEPRGSGGFGYDPYFFFPPLGKTFAELSAEEKFRVSHRGEAFRKLLDFLRPPSGRNPVR